MQIVLVAVVEFGFAHEMEVANGLYVDYLSLVMALIIGIIGSGISTYALGYMKDFQAHEPEGAKDRRPTFFALMFVFLSAMYVIVFSNNMIWMFTGWEVTTLCSFLLIGYTKTQEAIANAFRQIVMNLAGGIGSILALLFCVSQIGTLSLRRLHRHRGAEPDLRYGPRGAPRVRRNHQGGADALPDVVAGRHGSHLLPQAPFCIRPPWSRRGVFLLVKLAPCFLVSAIPSMMVMLVGGITFMLCSFMAISQTNAKRVLAYSTIANLGLITACRRRGNARGGVGGRLPHHLPRNSQVAAVPLRRRRASTTSEAATSRTWTCCSTACLAWHAS